MNSQLIAEVTALISAQSLSLVEGTQSFPPNALYDFWFHGQEHLKQHRKVIEPLTRANHQIDFSEDELEVILKDFFAEEMLIRIITTVFTAADQRRNQCQAEPIARSLFLSFLDVKRLVLLILVSEKHLSMDALKRVNRIRRTIERWTDLLMGQLVLKFGIEEFAHNISRAKEFGEDQLSQSNPPHPTQIWDLIKAGLRISFPSGITRKSGDDWELMLGAIMACYPSECFNHSATMKSLHLTRIQRSGLHPETNPNRQPEYLHKQMYRSKANSHQNENTSQNPSFNSNSNTSYPLQNNQPIGFFKLRKRK